MSFFARAAPLVLVLALTAGAIACPASAPPPLDDPRKDAGPGDDGEGEGEGDGDGDALPATSYCEELVDVFCPFYLRCGRMNVADVEACRAAFPASCEAKFEPRFVPLADAGLLSLSRAGLQACAAHLADVPCDEQFFELQGPCAGIWQGQVAAGGACGLDVETFVCAPGTTCALDLSFCGTCETVLPAGARCRDGTTDVDGACGPAGVCGDDDVCVARPRTNESCDPDGVPCVLPARCFGDGVCREPAVVGVGEACDVSRRCPYFAACEAGTCVVVDGLGAACVDDGDCEASFCAGGTCVALLPAAAPCLRSTQCGSGRCGDDGACADFAPRCFDDGG
jgi:hypothetical protein